MVLRILMTAILAVFWTSCSKKDDASVDAGTSEKVFTFTAIPDQDSTKLEERFGKVAKYLEGKLGVKVKYVPVKDYAASVLAFKNNDVQLAWFGGLSGVQARAAIPGSAAIAQGAEDVEFVSYFIANTSTRLKESSEFPKGLEGKTFTFGSKGSTSGRLMPEYYIRKHSEKAPEDYFKKVGFSGDHSKTLALVQDGAYETGALNYAVWDDAVKEGKVDTGKVTVIWKTPTYPDYNWSIRGDVDKAFGTGFLQKVQDALLSLDDQDILKQFSRSKFIKAENSLYQPILDTAKAIKIID